MVLTEIINKNIESTTPKKEENIDLYKDNLSKILKQKFWIKPNFEDPRLSEAAKQI